MFYTLFNIIYVLVAIAMTVFIMFQQGAGASAGAGFGAGASATVFGASGSANFLSKSTAVLATIFFAMSLGMAVHLNKTAGSASQGEEDYGIMGSAVPEANITQPAASAIPTPEATQQAVPAVSTPEQTEVEKSEEAEPVSE